MFGKLLCKNDCKQATVYVVAQSVWILLYAGFVLALLNKTSMGVKLLGPLIIMVVLTLVFFYLINFLCEKGHDTIAWIISFLPYISAIVWGYHMVPLMMKCITQGTMQNMQNM
jgi:hypothetical protein